MFLSPFRHFNKKAFLIPFLFLLVNNAASQSETTTNINAFKSSVLRENAGQWEREILFQTSSSARNIYFLENGLSFAITKNIEEKNDDAFSTENFHKTQTLVYNLLFEGCNKTTVSGKNSSPDNCNYLIGSKNFLNVADYKEIVYTAIYPHTDLRYYFNNDLIEYDYVLKPGAIVGNIKMRYDGVEKISVNNNGDFLVQTRWGIQIEKKPFAYQIINGTKKEVPVNYTIYENNSFGFAIAGAYDKSKDLIIDPVILDWSTYVGAAAGTQTWVNDIGVDALGYVYATGVCQTTFPTIPGTYNGGTYDAFVIKMMPDASSIVWATYIGGSGNDAGNGIAVNAAGEAFVCGTTGSNNFPITAGAVDNVFNYTPSFNVNDAFVLKLNAAGNSILYSTFLGGESSADLGLCIALSGPNEVVVGGDTRSPNFPTTTGCYDPTCVSGKMDGFVSHININPTGGAVNPANLLYSSFIGGDKGNESVRDIQFGSNGHIYFTGNIFQPDYPVVDFPTTSGALDNTYNTAAVMNDGFVCRINPLGAGTSDLIYSTYIGAPATWNGIQQQTMSNGIAISTVDPEVVYVTGQAGWGFPTTAVSPAYSGGQGDVFILKLRLNNNNVAPDMGDLIAGRYIGGSSQDSGFDIAVDSDEEVFVTGKAQIDFPTTCGAHQPVHKNNTDVFVAKLDNSLNILYSTFLGGSNIDFAGNGMGHSLALLGSGCKEEVVVGGTTFSNDFPVTTGVYQTSKLNNLSTFLYQGFIFKLADKTGVVTPDFTMSQTSAACGATVDFNFKDCDPSNPVTPRGWNPISTWHWDFGDGNTSTLTHPTHFYSGPGNYNAVLTVGTCSGTKTQTITINSGINVNVNPTSIAFCEGTNVILTASSSGTGGVNYSWITPAGNTGITTNTILAAPTTSTTYSVVASDPSGCTAQAITTITVFPLPLAIATNSGPVCSGSVAQLSVTSGASFVQWQPTASVINPLASSSATTPLTSNTTFSVTITDINGCSATSTTSVTVLSLPEVTFSAPDTAACKELCVNFTSQSATATNYFWNFGDGNSINTDDPIHCYTTSGVFSVSLMVTDINGCTANAIKTNYINIYSLPVAAFSANPQPATLAAPTISFTDLSSGAVAWQWSFGDPSLGASFQQNPAYTYDAAGTHNVILIVSNDYGCSDTAYNSITVNEESSIYIPNTFTPNDDGKNDLFIPELTGIDIEKYKLIVYDRWGNMIFETNNANEGWNGKANEGKKMAQIDTYIWKLSAQDITGKNYNYTGLVNLIR